MSLFSTYGPYGWRVHQLKYSGLCDPDGGPLSTPRFAVRRLMRLTIMANGPKRRRTPARIERLLHKDRDHPQITYGRSLVLRMERPKRRGGK